MEFVRGTVLESAANTYTVSEIPTPVSRTEKLAMLIWKIQIDLNTASLEDGQQNSMQAQLTRNREGGMLRLDDPGLLAGSFKVTEAGAAQGSLSEYLREYVDPPSSIQDFQPPFLFAKSEMFISAQGVGNSAALRASARVGYTLERIPADIFIAALVE